MKIKLIDFGYKKAPERKHYNDTGADVYTIEGGMIFPHSTLVIPVGFGIDLPDGYNAHFQARTSIAKQGILVHQCAIDAGYKGEINMIVSNTTDNVFHFSEGDRLAYLVVYPIAYVDYVKELGDERGSGAFGSTGV